MLKPPQEPAPSDPESDRARAVAAARRRLRSPAWPRLLRGFITGWLTVVGLLWLYGLGKPLHDFVMSVLDAGFWIALTLLPAGAAELALRLWGATSASRPRSRDR